MHWVAGKADGEVAGFAAAGGRAGHKGAISDVGVAFVVVVLEVIEVLLHIEVEFGVAAGVKRFALFVSFGLVVLSCLRIPMLFVGANDAYRTGRNRLGAAID